MKKNREKTKIVFKNYNDEILSLGQGAELKVTNSTVLEFFEKHVIQNPTKIALTHQGKSFTYKELNNWAKKIADNLLSQNVSKKNRVAILSAPSPGMIASVLGIIKSGAAYVPIDNTQPTECIISFLSDAKVSTILTNKGAINDFESIKNLEYLILDPEEILKKYLKSNNNNPFPFVSLEDPAYLIYTSGSTGEPKGVLIGHKELSTSTQARRIVYPEKAVFLLVSPLACDSSIAGIWGTLSSGGQLVIASYEEIRDPKLLIELIKTHNITRLLCIPTLYESILETIKKSSIELPSLETVIVAGEPLHQTLIDKHFKFFGKNKIDLVNEYGPTEATVWSSYHRFKLPEPTTIGQAIPGTKLYVLDNKFHLVSQGEVGELFIGGKQIAKGYFNKPEATSAVFFEDPFSKEKGARMYKTGDLVKWNDNNTLDFIGRKDNQVKIRGQRVELEAVETILRSFKEVREAVVVANSESNTLVAFIQFNSSENNIENLKQKLKTKLPSHMIPSKILVLEKFPVITSGKIDRRKLLDIAKNTFEQNEHSKTKKENTFKKGNFIEQVASIWSKILKVESVPKDVNFFDLGGHSLMVFKLQEEFESHTGYRPPIVALFQHTTVSAQASFIETNTRIEKKISLKQG